MRRDHAGAAATTAYPAQTALFAPGLGFLGQIDDPPE
ncbi:MAG: hypothetical protein JWN96_903 [Mycobacterium sp.]|nr:hypothetical protein [Mycobacterium sp.]